MVPRSTVTGNFASMIMSDSEPDFDGIEAINVHPARGSDKKAFTAKRGRDRQANRASRVLKPAERLSHNNGSRDSSRSATTRMILAEQNKNCSFPASSNESHKSYELDKRHDESSFSSRERRSNNSKRIHDSKLIKRLGQCSREIMVQGHRLESMDIDDNASSATVPEGSQDVACRRDLAEVSRINENNVDEVRTRNRMGELTKKYDNLEVRYNELREIGVKTAELNFERLKKQSEETTAASSKLICELKEELALQSAAIKQKEQVTQQLERSEANVIELEKTINDLNSSLSKARSEMNALSAKLTASRAAEANAKIPGSAMRVGTGGKKSAPSEVVLTAQAKEDLYGDLTGLIIRGTSLNDGEDVFDCIQTGRNGTLHFKLALGAEDGSDNYDDVQFTYKPQLDTGRDRDLMIMLPDYLVEEIIFTRRQASNFYSRLSKSLTGRLDKD
ncbi:hypothetical protein QQS21_001165 [Conoideocrella luteorostrata]|uniref:Monopolin complex subunit Csm1/Pcs1 C-terminal domain-containing protein n=1 Tax=Conoideocrella luteorostrata TaxID=1105319 RepID=A0AAJ0G244_9HYPO|nr:hypothetical protein QQS21_001165 [Conoideocrella luteorostrata]